MDNGGGREVERTIDRRIERALRETKGPKLGLVGVAITVVVHGVAVVAFIATLNQRVATLEKTVEHNKIELSNRARAIYMIEHIRQRLQDLGQEIKEVKRDLKK